MPRQLSNSSIQALLVEYHMAHLEVANASTAIWQSITVLAASTVAGTLVMANVLNKGDSAFPNGIKLAAVWGFVGIFAICLAYWAIAIVHNRLRQSVANLRRMYIERRLGGRLALWAAYLYEWDKPKSRKSPEWEEFYCLGGKDLQRLVGRAPKDVMSPSDNGSADDTNDSPAQGVGLTPPPGWFPRYTPYGFQHLAIPPVELIIIISLLLGVLTAAFTLTGWIIWGGQ